MQFWHTGILTHDIDSAIDFICAAFSSTHDKWTIMEAEFPQSKMIRGSGGKLRIAFGRVGGTVIELLQPLDDTSYHAHTLKTRGPGFHHNAYICGDDLDSTIETLTLQGGRVVWEFQDGDEHPCYIESKGGDIVFELINVCPFMPEE